RAAGAPHLPSARQPRECPGRDATFRRPGPPCREVRARVDDRRARRDAPPRRPGRRRDHDRPRRPAQGRAERTWTVEGTTMSQDVVARRRDRGRVVAWGLWDWGSAAFNAVIV